ncbi:hypothetical protein H4R21_000022 [Coemansia helicoidea]|uniref:Uncharacterized protein n=1 Tax=Coemansia helicoidea TaxID=1286919 RepID=A0ACC1LHZ8_9FUNG|nr:hypothetical protein H4R21_000022 [Coemansia helicoidea]
MNTACPRPAAFLFLTSDLRCLRIEEPGGARALLGHSLVSVVNRSVSDFVCDHDWPRLQLALEAARLAPRGCLAPRPIDPSAFQDLPLARLIHPVPATSGDSAVRAHLRTQSGSYRLFDICVYADTTPELGQAYVVCCITPLDVLDSLPAPLHGAWTPTAVPPAKRHCASLPTATPSPDALYLLATVTAGDTACTAGVSAPAPPTPALSTPSPSLAAFTPRLTPLPSLSAMLKAIGAGSPPAPQ